MTRLLRAGFAAAIRQFCTAAVMTILVALLVSPNDPMRFVREPNVFSEHASSFLVTAYLILAVGCALTIDKYTLVTAGRFQRASTYLGPHRSKSVLIAVIAQSVICAIALAVLGLREPPALVVQSFDFVASAWPIPILWPLALSVGVAVFGATAMAAHKAIQQ